MDIIGLGAIIGLEPNLGIELGVNPTEDITISPMDIIGTIDLDLGEDKDIIPAPHLRIGMEIEEGARTGTLGATQIGTTPAPPLGIRMVEGTIPEIGTDRDTPPKIGIDNTPIIGTTIDQHLGIDTVTVTLLGKATDDIRPRIDRGTPLTIDTIDTPPRIGINPEETTRIGMQIP